MDRVDAGALQGWTPVHIGTNGPAPPVTWAVVGESFTDPFFEQTAQRAMQRPFNLAFGRRTTPAALDAVRDGAPAIAPAGFIFHMSRCGSTVISQMLSRLASTVVLSEAQPFDALLRLRTLSPGRDDVLVGRLRGLMSALAQPRDGAERVFVKWNAWHALELPLIVRAFPGVPWIFVFRDPRAVLRSQKKLSGSEVVAGTIDPRCLGLDPVAVQGMDAGEYAALAVGAWTEAALRHAGLGRSAFVDYDTLPDGVFSDVLDFFGVRADEDELRGMREIAGYHTKLPRTTFSAGVEDGESSGGTERLAGGRLDAAYAAMRAAATSRSGGRSG